MTSSSLAAAVSAASDATASFGADGSRTSLGELARRADSVRRRLVSERGQRWALDLDDASDFASALIGCLAARKTPVIGARLLIEAADSSVRMDGIITDEARPVLRAAMIEMAALPRSGAEPKLDIEPDADFVLYTSGSTGKPKEISRHVKNAEAEVAVFEALWGRQVGSGRVYSTVSHRHVYGMLFRVLWPLMSRRAFAAFDLQYPEQLQGTVGAGNTLISSPALLKRIGHLEDASGRWSAIFSSGGLLPGEHAADARRVLGACPIEVLGSTETSGVAWRCQQDSDDVDWEVLPGASVRLDSDGLLEVESPFSGVTGWLKMGDMARLLSDTRFQLLGRGDHIAKIEDKRISLAEIDQILMRNPYVSDAASIAMESRSRQYVAAAVELSPLGHDALARLGRRGLSEELLSALKTSIDPVGLPKKFRYVERIPVNPQGKRTQAALRALFEES